MSLAGTCETVPMRRGNQRFPQELYWLSITYVLKIRSLCNLPFDEVPDDCRGKSDGREV